MNRPACEVWKELRNALVRDAIAPEIVRHGGDLTSFFVDEGVASIEFTFTSDRPFVFVRYGHGLCVSGKLDTPYRYDCLAHGKSWRGVRDAQFDSGAETGLDRPASSLVVGVSVGVIECPRGARVDVHCRFDLTAPRDVDGEINVGGLSRATPMTQRDVDERGPLRARFTNAQRFAVRPGIATGFGARPYYFQSTGRIEHDVLRLIAEPEQRAVMDAHESSVQGLELWKVKNQCETDLYGERDLQAARWVERAHDLWGQPFALEESRGVLAVVSGGPDRTLGTDDDVKRRIERRGR